MREIAGACRVAMIAVLGLGTASACAEAVADSAYVRDARGEYLRSGHGLCLRTGYWTPAEAVAECDPALIADATPPARAVAEVQKAEPAAAPISCEFTYATANGETFGFDNAVLTHDAESAIERHVISRLRECDDRMPVRVTGYTDFLGSQQYNLNLSGRRAEAVARFLVANGIDVTRIAFKAAGEKEPVKICDQRLRRKQLIECLAPNRRTVIEAGRTAGE